ncbi:p22 protein [Bacillus phage vB_BanS_MrDarsey]|uniref:P22 protein n=1 Tax=Bacillus phage vB_BanS_MrDarsey TaxID=2894787 RepID=A0AAE9CBB6_9CAUD|nr:p22 protein [Bacillus phage vB_BanS_MrDarsey]UGO47928.1 p22 protein [Bacillus phage vB_BanS_MrDarsey]
MNETTKLLKDFAKEQGINVNEVDKFLTKRSTANTLDELLKVPEGLLNHVEYITWLGEPLKSFISNDMWNERHETISLDTVVDCLRDRIYDLIDVDLDEVDIKDLKIEDDEESQKQLEKYQKIAQYIIDTKFGSVVYDW